LITASPIAECSIVSPRNRIILRLQFSAAAVLMDERIRTANSHFSTTPRSTPWGDRCFEALGARVREREVDRRFRLAGRARQSGEPMPCL
jgi:hypothetical protein